MKKRIIAAMLAAVLFLSQGIEQTHFVFAKEVTENIKTEETSNDKSNALSAYQMLDTDTLYAGCDLSTEEQEQEEFTSKRLIIQTDGRVPELSNASFILPFGENLYALSYRSTKIAKAAYEAYQQMDGIVFMEEDKVVEIQTAKTEQKTEAETAAKAENEETEPEEKTDTKTAKAAVKEGIKEATLDLPKEETKEPTLEEEVTKEQEVEEEQEALEQTDILTEEPLLEESEIIPEEPEIILEEPEINLEENVTADTKAEAGEVSEPVLVAVLDSGIDSSIVSFAENVQDSMLNFSDSGERNCTQDDNGHGTEMAQIIVSTFNENKTDALNLNIMPVKVVNRDGYGSVLSTYLGIQAAIDAKADMISLSINTKTDSVLLKGILEKASAAGILVVGAAGNQGTKVSSYAPGNIKEAVIVSSVKNKEERDEMSNYGETIDFCAYGTKTVTNLSGAEEAIQGTSVACAYVTGLAATIDDKSKRNEEIVETLKAKATDLGEKGYDTTFGYGLLGDAPQKETTDSQRISDCNTTLSKTETIQANGGTATSGSGGIYTTDGYNRTGYHLETDRIFTCTHNEGNSKGYVECNGATLQPSKDYLKSMITSKGVTIEDTKILNIDAGGINNTVSHFAIQVKVNGDYHTVATPYVCLDGYAGYAYYRINFSKCEYTKEWYLTGSRHVWYGCTRGDIGINEADNHSYTHKVTEYREVANTYTIKYNANGGSGSMSNTSCTYDAAKTLRNNSFTRTGYAFSGWNTKKDGTGTAYANKASVKNLTATDGGSVTLYAQWQVNTGSITYNANGGTITDSPHKWTNDSGTIYKFQLNSTGDVQSYITSVSSKSNHTKTVKYTSANSDLSNVGTFNLTKEGYHVNSGEEWVDASGKVYSQTTEYTPLQYFPTLATVTNQSKVLYANWKPDTYTMKYNANGGTGTMANGTKTYGVNYTIKKNAFIWTGHDFTGWNTKADGTGTAYAENGSYTKNENVTLYAQWEEHFNVAYIGNEQTKGEDFIDSGSDGNGISQLGGTSYAFDTNQEAADASTETEDHFNKKEEVAAYTDEETGQTVKETIESTVVGWGFNKNTTEKDYDLGQEIASSRLLMDATKVKNITTGAPAPTYGQFKEDNLLTQVGVSSLGSSAVLSLGVNAFYNSSTAQYVNLYAIWDSGAIIEAYDLYFTLSEAQTGFITEQELLDYATAYDEELKNSENPKGTLAYGVDAAHNTSFTVSDYLASDFITFTGAGSVSITYEATDAVGNVTKKMVTVHIVDPEAHDPNWNEGNIRFISKKYLNTLDADSIWNTNAEYHSLLLEVLDYERVNNKKTNPLPVFGTAFEREIEGTGEWNKEPEEVWQFTHAQIREAHTFVDTYGYFNYQTENGLQLFLEQFGGCKVE